MKKQINNLKMKWLTGIMLSIILLTISTAPVMAATTYETSLEKGTDIYVVNVYNDAVWKSTVNSTSLPNDWFQGDTNILGAESKLTLKGYIFTTWNTYDILTSIILPFYFNSQQLYGLLAVMEAQGYNETTVNSNYSSSYKLWYGIRSVWNFTNGVYEEFPSYTDGVIVFQNPSQYKTMLDDYMSIATELNANPIIQFAGFNLPNLTADVFLWRLALNGLAIAKPQSEYLTELTSELGSINTSAEGNTLIFNRYGITNYTVEIEYGSKGIMSSFTVKDNNQTIIFQLISKNSDWIFFTILTIVCVATVVFITFMIIRSRKLKKI